MTDVPPEQWDTSAPPSAGQIAEAGVSWAVDRGPQTGWQHRATLRHAATGNEAQAVNAERHLAIHAAWAGLRELVLDHHPHDAVAEAARYDERTINP